MKHFKINVDRKKLSSEHIQSRQDFSSVLNGAKLSKSSVNIWKTTWFYGVVGMAGVATVVGYYFNKTEKKFDETIITQKTEQVQESKEFAFYPIRSLAYDEVSLAINEEPQMRNESQSVKNVQLVDYKKETTVKPITVAEKNNDSQTETKPIVEESVVEQPIASKRIAKSNMPSISGVYNGDISWENFKEGEVFVGEDLSVKQFSIQYTTRMGDRTISVKGNKIPSEVVTDLEKLGLDQTIFITNVVAGDQTGELMRLVSMDLNLKFK